MSLDAGTARRSRVLIFSSRSWGELGNRLSAKRLQSALEKSGLFDEIEHESFEDFCPYFAEIGQRIRGLSQSADSPQTRRAQYDALIAEVHRSVESGKLSSDELGFGKVRDRISAGAPNVVIGTKGLISRLVCDALGPARARGPRVVNYVTNDGLLTLPVHVSAAPDLQIVQTEAGERRLMAALPELDPDRVSVMGPMISAPSFGRQVPLNLGLFINRGGDEYWPLIESLADAGRGLELQIICSGNDRLLDLIVRFARSRGLAWRIDGELPVDEYLSRLDDLAQLERRAFVCKSAPSTVFEALARGIPVLAMDSGLPMETWVGELVADAGLGGFYRDMPALVAATERLVNGDDALITTAKAQVPCFIRDVLGAFKTGSRVSRLISQMPFEPLQEITKP